MLFLHNHPPLTLTTAAARSTISGLKKPIPARQQPTLFVRVLLLLLSDGTYTWREIVRDAREDRSYNVLAHCMLNVWALGNNHTQTKKICVVYQYNLHAAVSCNRGGKDHHDSHEIVIVVTITITIT